ncbi:MAG: hypothetical protein JEZ04_15665 [Spirochaetales bacterium]|nr:hypothetical protein [Spirochaetales bacterium]
MKINKISRVPILLSVIAIIIFFCSSCATTNIPTTWVDSTYSGGSFKKIVVIGVFRNSSTRKEFETEVVKKINADSSTEAISSLKFMTPGVVYEHGSMEKQFNEKGIDGILIIRTKSIDNQRRYIPGKSYTVTRAYPMYYYNYPYYYKYYRYTYETIHKPGYYKDTYIVSTESTLFQNSNDKMIWMMGKNTTQTYETENGVTDPKNEAIRSAGLIYKDLKLNGFLLGK